MAEAPSDEDLMRALAAGSAEALRLLHGRHARWVFARARQRLDVAAAEEVVQEVFLGVVRANETFDPARGTFRAWLGEATRRRVANELRRRARKGGATGDVDVDALAADDPGPDELAWRAHRSAVLERAVDALPKEQGQALRLAFFEDLSHEEIAAMLRVPLGTTKTRIRAGLKKLGVALAAIALAVGLVWSGREARRRALDDRALAMVTSSDAERVRLEPLPGVPKEAHGNYRRRPGVSVVVLTISELSPGGVACEAWARAGGRTIALGSVTPDASGKALLIAEEPALAEAPEAVWVTRGGATVLAWERR